MTQPRTGLVCSNIKRATKIKKLLKHEQATEFLFDCRDKTNVFDHLKEYEIDVLVIDYLDALKMGNELCDLSQYNSQIVLVYNDQDKDSPIPTCFLMFSVIALSDTEKELRLAIDVTSMGAQFFSSRLANSFKAARRFLSAPNAKEISMIQIEVINAYLEGGTVHEMASKVCVSEATFKKHLQRIRTKLNLKSNNEIIDFLRKAHWCNFESGKIMWF